MAEHQFKQLSITVLLEEDDLQRAMYDAGFDDDVVEWVMQLPKEPACTHLSVRMADFNGECTILIDTFYLEGETRHGVSKQFHRDEISDWSHVSTSLQGSFITL